MKKIFYWLFTLLLLISIQSLNAQVKNEPQKAIFSGKSTKVYKTTSLASKKELTLFENKGGEMKDGRSSKYDIVIGKGSKGDDVLAKKPHPSKNTIKTNAPSLVFETAESDSEPTDPAGAVGPNHYFAVTNTAFRIFDKSGNPLTDLLRPENIFPSIPDVFLCCDLTVSYDNAADRWVVSILNDANAGEPGAQIAVSDGPNPVTAGWTVYYYDFVTDYQKLSVWSDGYYMTENTEGDNRVHVFERDAMLAGDTGAQVQSFELPGIGFTLNSFHSPQVFNVTNDNLPTTGNATVVYMQDDAWTGISNDHIKLWNINVDWATPANSEVSAAIELGNAEGVSDFISVFDGAEFDNLTQPEGGQDIDAIQATIMNQAQFRKFPTHNSALFNFVVDTDGTDEELAGVRWYELRQSADGEPWSVYQEGTYTAPDGRHAWLASLAMDGQGNIGMGYTSMSGPTTPTTVRVGSYYTGRFAADPLGVMTVSEEVILAGDENIPGGERYGDYSKIDVDPSNDKKFWFVNELMSNGRKNVAGVFQIASDAANDIGVTLISTPNAAGTFTNTEVISVNVFNFGSNPAENFDVTYQIDGGTIVSERFTGTLAPVTSQLFTFTITADLSTIGDYTLVSKTIYNGDENNSNDTSTLVISSLTPVDLGVTAITNPNNAEGLANEPITITIENFGGEAQSGFEVSYVLDGGAPVIEMFTGAINIGETATYTFTTLGDFSELGDHNIIASTVASGDANSDNDAFTKNVINLNLSCNSEIDETVQQLPDDAESVTTSTITITDDFIVRDVNVTLNLDHTYVSDLDINLIGPNGVSVSLASAICGDCDNFINTVFDDEATTSIQNTVEGDEPFTGSFAPNQTLTLFDGIMSAGDWTLEIDDVFPEDGGTFNNWSIELCENVALSVDTVLVKDGLSVISQDNNQFLIKLETNAIQESLDLNILNTLGQNLLWKTVKNESGNGYEYKLDMSYAASGIYFVRIGNNSASNIKRIIVK